MIKQIFSELFIQDSWNGAKKVACFSILKKEKFVRFLNLQTPEFKLVNAIPNKLYVSIY